jgi:NMT1 family protein
MSEPAQNSKARLWLPTRLPRISWRDLAIVTVPTLLIVAAALVVAAHFIRPAPPTHIVMTSGTDGSTFRNYAERYRKILARNGITLEILSSRGSVENLKRLSDPKQHVDIGFVQGGLPSELRSDDLVSLGSMFYEPLFVLYHSAKPIDRLSDLTGKRLATGREGSGGEALALALLKANGIEPGGATTLLSLPDDEALQAISTHRADAVFLAGDSARPDEIRRMLHTPGLRLFEFTQVDAYLRRFRYLNRIDLPMGALDLGQNLPAHPMALIAPTVELVAHSDLHPALSDLLIEAAQEVHGHGTLLQQPGEFPMSAERDFPISDDATRYYKSGKSFVYRHMPFWLASLADRLLVLVPVIVVAIPTLRLLPAMYGWRVRRRIYRRYALLMALERESQVLHGPEQARSILERLEAIEAAVINLKLPPRFADEAYVLRQHIDFVRARLASFTAAAATGTRA